MEHVLIGEPDKLAALSNELHQSPEEFLLNLEEALDSGAMTLEEAITFINDHNLRNL